MDTYVVRIYRRDRKDPKKVAGVVEGIGNEERKGFLGPESLWRILTATCRESKPTAESSGGRKSGKVAMTLAEVMKQIAKEME